MDNEAKPKARVKHPDRVALTAEALTRLANWSGVAHERLKGSRITKSDLVNFLVLSHPPELTEGELERLKSQHFDEVRFAEWALRQMKEMKAQGKTVSLADIINTQASTIQGEEK